MEAKHTSRSLRGRRKVKCSTEELSMNKEVKPDGGVDIKDTNTPFLYNGRFSVLTVLCSLPLLYFGGERLFGVGTICLLAVYVLHVTFSDTKSSVIAYVISVVVMQLSILYAIGPLLWHSFFNLILLFVYNVFIVLTGGFGLIQFEIFRKEEKEFCANVEYFLFLLYPPTCLLILMWIFSLTFDVHLAPYLLIIFGFPICHTFLDPKIKCSFIKADYVLGHPEKMLALLNFILSPSIVYFLINISYLLHYASWIAMCFCMSVPSFLVTFLDTTDIRDIADINNSHWQFFQVASGCLSLILGNILIYLHGMVDGVRAVFLGVILICSTTVFVTVKYRYSQLVSCIACALLLTIYIAWLGVLPWSLVFSMGSTIKLSFFAVELLISILVLLSVLAIAVSISIYYRSFLNYILVLHTFGFVLLEQVLVEDSSYSVYMMIITSILVLYLIHRLHYVGRLNKTSSLMCISLHGSKLVLYLSSSNQTIGNLSLIANVLGGLLFCSTVTNVMLFEHTNHLDRNKALTYAGYLLVSLIALSPNFLRVLWIMMTHNEPSTAHIIGVILVLTGLFLIKISFLNMDDNGAKKHSFFVLFIGVLFIVIQPFFDICQIAVHVPKIIFREVFYETWQVVLAEYLILPWCLLLSLTIVVVLSLKLLQLKELSSLSLHIISFLVGAPVGLYVAHLMLPYPQISSSFLSVPYILSTSITINSLLLSLKDTFHFTNLKMYLVFVFLSITSVVLEMTENITINILQAPVPPSILFQGILHLVKIFQLRQECILQTSLDMTKSSFPSIACNISVALVFISGLCFASKSYYDILLVPVCSLLLFLRLKYLGFVTRSKRESSINWIIFTLVLGLILYRRLLQQLPLYKMSFWIIVGFILEISVAIITLPVFIIILLVFWKDKMSRTEERCLALLAPVFTLLLFYGRTSAGQVLGVGAPILTYYAFHYPAR